jgi:serpin B
MSLSRRSLGRLTAGLLAAPLVAPALAARKAEAAKAQVPPLGRAQAGFALGLVGLIGANGDRNVSLSPSGLSAVLAQLDIGADKAMRDAIAKTLQLGKSKDAGIDDLREAMRLVAAVAARPGTPLASADALFVAKTVDLKPGIEDKAQAEGGALVMRVDFTSEEAVKTINKWAADRTGGRIATLLEPGTNADLVAANAMAFKDAWRTPFEAEATGHSPFTRLDGTTVETDMMYQTGSLQAATKGRFAAVELPYADSRFSMVLVTTTDAPAKPDAFGDAAELLSGTGLASTDVSLALPRFQAEQSHDLIETLAALGLSTGLASAGQLSGFADGLRLGAVRQKIFVKVDEKGTEAAAATAALATRSVASGALNVRFDKPFTYALRHRPTGIILVGGYVADPTK